MPPAWMVTVELVTLLLVTVLVSWKVIALPLTKPIGVSAEAQLVEPVVFQLESLAPLPEVWPVQVKPDPVATVIETAVAPTFKVKM